MNYYGQLDDVRIPFPRSTGARFCSNGITPTVRDIHILSMLSCVCSQVYWFVSWVKQNHLRTDKHLGMTFQQYKSTVHIAIHFEVYASTLGSSH